MLRTRHRSWSAGVGGKYTVVACASHGLRHSRPAVASLLPGWSRLVTVFCLLPSWSRQVTVACLLPSSCTKELSSRNTSSTPPLCLHVCEGPGGSYPLLWGCRQNTTGWRQLCSSECSSQASGLASTCDLLIPDLKCLFRKPSHSHLAVGSSPQK